jgi:hypothetical protein
MIKTINRILAEVMEERSLDWRTCFTAIVSRPPDGRTVVCECSDEAVLGDLRERVLQEVGEEGRRLEFVALPAASAGLPGPGGLIAASSVADVRRTPAHAAELVTQIVYGDAVTPLKESGDWYLVRLDDGYIGWIRSWHLFELSVEGQAAFSASARHRVAVNHAAILEGPGNGALPVTDLVIGTPLVSSPCGRRGWRAVRLPDGKEGFTESRSIEKTPVRKRISREQLSSTGMRFLGIPYIWGGTTPKGFDCSGLIQRIFRLGGRLLPRDADQQALYGLEKPAGGPDSASAVQKLATGDLIFFGKTASQITHVALILPENLFLHAYGQVKVGSLDPRSQLFDADLAGNWRITRDVLSPCT